MRTAVSRSRQRTPGTGAFDERQRARADALRPPRRAPRAARACASTCSRVSPRGLRSTTTAVGRDRRAEQLERALLGDERLGVGRDDVVERRRARPAQPRQQHDAATSAAIQASTIG